MKYFVARWQQFRGPASHPKLFKFSVVEGEEMPTRDELIKASGTVMSWNESKDKWQCEECGELAWHLLIQAQTVTWGERGAGAIEIRRELNSSSYRTRQRELWLQGQRGMGGVRTGIKIKLAEDGCGTYVPTQGEPAGEPNKGENE